MSVGGNPSVIDGLVLAGGRSRRFGSDKRLAKLDGEELVRRAYEKLASVVDGTVYVGTGSERTVLPGLARATVVVDQVHDRGPLAGIASALLSARDGILVLACDLPLVRRTTLASLARMARGSDRPVALRGPEGWEPLIAWYPRSSLDTIRQVLRSPRPAPHVVLERLGARAVPVLDTSELINVNTPDDLAAAAASSGTEASEA